MLEVQRKHLLQTVVLAQIILLAVEMEEAEAVVQQVVTLAAQAEREAFLAEVVAVADTPTQELLAQVAQAETEKSGCGFTDERIN